MTDLVSAARVVKVYQWVADPGEWSWQPNICCQSRSRAALPGLSTCVLSYLTENSAYQLGAEVVGFKLPVGSEVLVKYADEGETPGAVLFHGYVVTASANLGGDGESATWLCKSALTVLAEAFPVGCWSRDYGDFTDDDPDADKRTQCTGLVPVFNPEGVGNASQVWFQKGSPAADVCPLFSPAGDVILSESWTYASALLYLFEQATAELEGGCAGLAFPDATALAAVTPLAGLPRDLSIEGRSYLEAISEILRLAGCRATETLSGDLESGVTHTLAIAAIGAGTQKTLLLQAANSVLDPDLSNTMRMDLALDGSGLVNAPLVVGGRGEYEGTWPLVPGWLVSLLDEALYPGDDDYQTQYRTDGTNHLAYRDVGRLWLLNETGAVSGALYGSQDLFDLSAAVATDVWARRPRPFRRPLSIDATTEERLPVLLEISCDAGAHWLEVGGGYEVLPEAAGIRLTESDLKDVKIESEYWDYATLWDALIDFADPATMGPVLMRLTATLESDGRLLAAAEPPSGCPVSRSIGLLYDRRTSLVKRVRLESGSYASTYYAQGKDDDARSDSAAASAEADAIAAVTSNLTVHGSATVDNVGQDYDVGDVITALWGRNISFAAHGTMATAVYAEIVAITETFGQTYVTEVVLEDLQRAVLAGRPV